MNARRFLFRSAIKADQFLAASGILRRSMGKAKTVFFPGCSLSGYNPDYVFTVRDYLREKLGECGIITACCAKPLKLMGEEMTFQRRIERVGRELDAMNAEKVITACQNCYNILRKYDAGRNILSLWPVMLKFGLPESLRDKFSGLEAGIQDSCTSTPEIVSSVREILKYLGVNAKEFSGQKQKCCGGKQTLITGDSRFGHECMRKRADEAPCRMIISYCASCRSAMSIDSRHESIHILDLIFGNGKPSAKKLNLINRFITARKLKGA